MSAIEPDSSTGDASHDLSEAGSITSTTTIRLELPIRRSSRQQPAVGNVKDDGKTSPAPEPGTVAGPDTVEKELEPSRRSARTWSWLPTLFLGCQRIL